MFFTRNIERKGKVFRAILALILLGAGVILARKTPWLGRLLLGIGLFCAIEALSGWCFLRACGIKTRI